MTKRYGVLICNLGTPDSCSVRDVKKFLKEFLWDPRVVKASRIVWWFVLNVIILNTRPKRTARAYARVWTEKGSPLLAISKNLTEGVSQRLIEIGENIPVETAMRYGNPSMKNAISRLREKGADFFLVIPMYPQYSYTTTASVKDDVFQSLDKNAFHIVCDYHDNPDYLSALASSISDQWDKSGRSEKLVMSFHGIPQEYVDDGDPYYDQCQITARQLAERLNLQADEWIITFQSRLGPKKWLTPYTDETLKKLGEQGIQSVDIVCPGFSVDCLETLEEIAMENRDVFLQAGGKRYQYIPCLNATQPHIDMLTKLIKSHTA